MAKHRGFVKSLRQEGCEGVLSSCAISLLHRILVELFWRSLPFRHLFFLLLWRRDSRTEDGQQDPRHSSLAVSSTGFAFIHRQVGERLLMFQEEILLKLNGRRSRSVSSLKSLTGCASTRISLPCFQTLSFLINYSTLVWISIIPNRRDSVMTHFS